MKLKDALKLAYKASFYVWYITIECEALESIGKIHCIHHCWNDKRGDLHYADFLYSVEGMGFQHVSIPLRDDYELDFSDFPGLHPDSDGWRWNYNTENMLKECFVELAEVVARFTDDTKNSKRNFWFTQKDVDALKTFCFVHKEEKDEPVEKSSEQVSE